MTSAEATNIPVILATTLGTEQWNIALPTNVVVQKIITRLVQEPSLPFRQQDDLGNRVPYRLMWREGGRHLGETETLGQAGVVEGNTLVMTHQARAGGRAR
ncbi:EsaB/YukD family protein [Longispora sp. K20-0274]|uniref:EsaB/YukD family protein n=1 Tax=Longispora sp. K20-0274 TaxID=3088255 RepID=UPI00399C3FD7